MDEEAATPTRDVARVQESLLALEVDRLYDVFRDDASDDAQRRAAVDHAVAWFLQLWREDRLFLQRTALPLVAFRLFEKATADGEERDDALECLLRRLGDAGPTDAAKEFFARHVALEYQSFATVLGAEEASADALSRVTKRFLSVCARHSVCVETLKEAFGQRLTKLQGKKALLQLVEQTERLTPAQKVDVFLHVCKVEPAASTRELAVRSLQAYAANVSSATDVIPLLADKSQKIRRIAAGCIIDIGMDCLREELEDDRVVAETIVRVAESVSGAAQEKRFAAFVGEYFAAASNMDEMCELSIHLDEANVSSHPLMAKTLNRVVGAALKPSFFDNCMLSQSSVSPVT